MGHLVASVSTWSWQNVNFEKFVFNHCSTWFSTKLTPLVTNMEVLGSSLARIILFSLKYYIFDSSLAWKNNEATSFFKIWLPSRKADLWFSIIGENHESSSVKVCINEDSSFKALEAEFQQEIMFSLEVYLSVQFKFQEPNLEKTDFDKQNKVRHHWYPTG